MSLCVRKPTNLVPTWSDTNQPVQSHKETRSWKFWIKKEEELYYLCSENKGADCFAIAAKHVCAFVFAYADCLISNAAAHILSHICFYSAPLDLVYSLHVASFIREMYTCFNPTFMKQNWGMQGHTYFLCFCSKI